MVCSATREVLFKGVEQKFRPSRTRFMEEEKPNCIPSFATPLQKLLTGSSPDGTFRTASQVGLKGKA